VVPANRAIVRAILMILGAAAYLAVVVIIRGGIAPFFSYPPLTALAIATMAMAVAAVFAGGNVSPGVREDRSNRWVLGAFGMISLLITFLSAWTDRRGVWTFDGDLVRWIGVVLYGVGGTLRIWPVFVLGRRFSGLVAIQPGHTLVTTGIYHTIRHPSYLGLLISTLGWGLAFHSGVGVLLAALLLPPLLARIRAEEKLLQSQFGAEYDAYRARTWRLIPRLY